jgi:ATP-binding cassette subfamily F protein 3
MSLVSFQDVQKSYGPEVVFDRLGLNFYSAQKVGLIGPNGSGKTTLFKMILKDEQPDSGRIVCDKTAKIGYLPQEPIFEGDRTVIEEMHEGLSEILSLNQKMAAYAAKMETLSGRELADAMSGYDRLCHQFETAGGYACEARIKSILAGLGIGSEHYDVKTSTLSGGQLSRLGLAKVLAAETNLLLLDEPTNHLDLQATTWLESFLRSYNGSVVLISHDRYLLDRISEKIVELHNRTARVWKGNYTQYLQTRKTVALAEQRQHEKRVETVAKTLDFIARNKDQEGMRKTARGRKKRLERLLKENPDYLKKGAAAKSIHFSFAGTDARSDLVLRAENLNKAFGQLILFENLSFDVNSGDRLGITGPNGTGKTTLLRLAMEQIAPDAGTIRLGRSLKVGYLDQQATTLNPDKTVLEEARAVRLDLSPEAIRGKLGAFLFSGDDVFKTVGDLSGGQQNRLMLCKLVLSEPDVLILDEPTNHLDIASRERLEEALIDYNGTVIAVSHDRYFLDRVMDRLLIVGADDQGRQQFGAIDMIPAARSDTDGVFSSYVLKIQAKRTAAEKQKIAENRKKQTLSSSRSPKNKTPDHLRKFNKYSIEQLEEMIHTQELTLEQMRDSFGDETVYQDHKRLTQLQADVEQEQQKLNLLYEAWEYRAS